ncbi:nitroreductase family protein [Paratractidigestivibacter sp.]|uniref:nitroreductase family protein n=1 Tax=Paratractidigestivibacter sp. TaxID=2847316 RepID=UPI002ACB13C8|nr:nitroreductase family protein [Paratractidigestivibacter sp.]
MDSETFDQLVKGARTYRRYDGEPVGEDVLRGLVDAARFAPTGNNMQLLRFHVVSADDTAEAGKIFSHLHWAGALKDWDGPVEGELPGGYVIICLPEKLAENPVRLIDVGIASQTVVLAAASRGLGACMHKSYDACLGDELGLTDAGYVVSMVVSLGGRGEKVVLEPATTEHGLTYWREADGSHHVPKLSLDGLLI